MTLDLAVVRVGLKFGCASLVINLFDEGVSAAESGSEMMGTCHGQAMSDHDLERAIVLERGRLEQRTRVANALQGTNRHTPESAMRVADRAVQAATEAVRAAERACEKDHAYRAVTIQTMFGPRTREQNDAGLRAWAEGLLAERQALLSCGSPDDAAEARLWNLAVEAVNAKIKNKRAESILGDVVGRAERSAACMLALHDACVRLDSAKEHLAKLASAHVGCLDTALALDLVEKSRAQLSFLESWWSQRGLPALSLVDERRERIERNKARAMELRAAKRARLGKAAIA